MSMNACQISPHATLVNNPLAQDWNHTLERRHAWKGKDVKVFWYNPFTHVLMLPNDLTWDMPATATLDFLLDKIAVHTSTKYHKAEAILYLVSGKTNKNRPPREWFFEEADGWSRTYFAWHSLQIDYTHVGFKVNIYGTCAFFDDCLDMEVMHEARAELDERLQNTFAMRDYPALRPTPAQTGKELLLVSLPKGKVYPRLPDALIDVINHNFGQARIETFTPKQEIVRDGCYILDGRWMYAACLSQLPAGEVYRDNVNEFVGAINAKGTLAPYCPALYKVAVTVPDGWKHIGLLKSSKAENFMDETGHYPNTPGATFTNWTTCDELALALHHGWHVEILERIIWPHKETDQLATWKTKLKTLREQIEHELRVRELTDHDRQVLELVKGAIRSILLFTIGSFHKFYTWSQPIYTPRSELPIMPALEDILGKRSYRVLSQKGNTLIWEEAIPLSENKQRFIHPEYSAIVWGRARARLAEFALKLPYESIVSLMTDCVWSVSYPNWIAEEDTKKPGAFRLKDRTANDFIWPVDSGKMRDAAIKQNLEYKYPPKDEER